MSGDGAKVAYPLFQEEGGGSNPTSPLQFIIGRIEMDLAIELNKQWHSRLPIVSKNNIIRTRDNICFGAYFNNKLYACAIWTSPIARKFNNMNYLELRRMAISGDAPKNTASRMISIMTKIIKKELPHIVKLISYQDTEVHIGTIYKASGWQIGRISGPKECRWGKGNNKQRIKDLNQNICPAGASKVRWEKDIK